MTNKKIYIIFSGSSTVGGAETMNATIANYLSTLLNAKVYFVVYEGGPILGRLNQDVAVIVLNTRSSIYKILRLVKLINKLQGEKILISSVTGVNFLAALSVHAWRCQHWFAKLLHITKKSGIDLICWEVNPLHARLNINRYTKYKIKFSYYVCNKLLVISKEIYSEFSQFLYDNTKIQLLGCPVVKVGQRKACRKTSLSNTESYIIAVARHHPQKDLLLLVEVYYHLKTLGFKTKLKLFGHSSEGYTPALINAIRKFRLTQEILLFEPVDDILMRLMNAEFMIHTAAWEGLGNSLIEAISVGTPVVATNCPGGIQDFLITGKNGLLLNGRNPEKIARQIIDNLAQIKCLKGSDMTHTVSEYEQDFVIKKMLGMNKCS